ncbi:hypothetical protein F5880DRAFT_1617862 [Lentinula raphanica]|nr:hypothetical protein F5880DRAFT_1617862 [Lentinula raphanica]
MKFYAITTLLLLSSLLSATTVQALLDKVHAQDAREACRFPHKVHAKSGESCDFLPEGEPESMRVHGSCLVPTTKRKLVCLTAAQAASQKIATGSSGSTSGAGSTSSLNGMGSMGSASDMSQSSASLDGSMGGGTTSSMGGGSMSDMGSGS